MFTWLNRLQPFGALVLRLVLGAVMISYGYKNSIPPGALRGFTHFVQHLGFPLWLGYVAAFTELIGGIFLVLGLLTRVSAMGIAITMAVAVLKVHLHAGLTGRNGQEGYEYALALFAMALMLVFTGGGLLSVDQAIGKGKL